MNVDEFRPLFVPRRMDQRDGMMAIASMQMPGLGMQVPLPSGEIDGGVPHLEPI